MAITQSRMVSLLHAARDYEQAYNRLITLIHDEASHVRSGRATLHQALTNIYNMANPVAFLSDPINSAKSIALEAAHFTDATQRRNAKVAFRQRLERATPASDTRSQRQGPTTPTTAPASLYPQYRHNPSPFEAGSSIEDPSQPLYTPEYTEYLANKHRTPSSTLAEVASRFPPSAADDDLPLDLDLPAPTPATKPRI